MDLMCTCLNIMVIRKDYLDLMVLLYCERINLNTIVHMLNLTIYYILLLYFHLLSMQLLLPPSQ